MRRTAALFGRLVFPGEIATQLNAAVLANQPLKVRRILNSYDGGSINAQLCKQALDALPGNPETLGEYRKRITTRIPGEHFGLFFAREDYNTNPWGPCDDKFDELNYQDPMLSAGYNQYSKFDPKYGDIAKILKNEINNKRSEPTPRFGVWDWGFDEDKKPQF